MVAGAARRTACRPSARDIDVLTRSSPSGPLIAAAGQRPLAARWITGHYEGRSYLECLFSNFGPWTRGLNEAGTSAQLVTVYPALPEGVHRVDVVLSGVFVFRRLPVSAAPDGATRLAPPMPAEVGTSTYDDTHPSQGWSSNQWPTPVPDPTQLHDYETSIEKITTLTS